MRLLAFKFALVIAMGLSAAHPAAARGRRAQKAAPAQSSGMPAEQQWRLLVKALFAGCDRHEGQDCNQLGVMFLNGRGVDRSEKDAAIMFARGCELGSASACNNLGIAHATGQGVPFDMESALVMFEKACGQGLRQACENAERIRREPCSSNPTSNC